MESRSLYWKPEPRTATRERLLTIRAPPPTASQPPRTLVVPRPLAPWRNQAGVFECPSRTITDDSKVLEVCTTRKRVGSVKTQRRSNVVPAAVDSATDQTRIYVCFDTAFLWRNPVPSFPIPATFGSAPLAAISVGEPCPFPLTFSCNAFSRKNSIDDEVCAGTLPLPLIFS